MVKPKKKSTKKGLPEGIAIALTVGGVTVGIIAAIYLIKLLLEFFLPGLFG